MIETDWQAVMEMEAAHIAQTYKRPPFVLTHGKGVTLYDSAGNAYLDMVAGIAVNALGYSDAELTAAIQGAAGSLIHVSNLYHTAPQAELAAALCAKSFADRVFFCNSGTEATEGAIKFARKVAYERDEHERRDVVAFSDGFHGRTMGALAVTPKPKYQEPFAPLMPGAKIGTFNDLDSAAALIGEHTAAVIVEPVQGEGGINLADDTFLQGLRRLCDENGALLIFDEVQCGVGRTGTLWAHEPSGVSPDIMTLAKPLAGGLPIGAILMTQTVADALKPGDHGSTFAGGALVTAAAKVVLERISQPAFLEHVNAVGDYLAERLQEINSPVIEEVRGRGLMIGMQLSVPAAPLIEAGYKHGLLLLNAGEHVLRFVPPLVLEKSDVDVLIERLTTVFEEAAHG